MDFVLENASDEEISLYAMAITLRQKTIPHIRYGPEYEPPRIAIVNRRDSITPI